MQEQLLTSELAREQEVPEHPDHIQKLQRGEPPLDLDAHLVSSFRSFCRKRAPLKAAAITIVTNPIDD